MLIIKRLCHNKWIEMVGGGGAMCIGHVHISLRPPPPRNYQ